MVHAIVELRMAQGEAWDDAHRWAQEWLDREADQVTSGPSKTQEKTRLRVVETGTVRVGELPDEQDLAERRAWEREQVEQLARQRQGG